MKNGRSIRYGYDEGLHLVSKVDNYGNEVYFLDGIKVENGRVSFDIEVLGGTAARYENGVLKRHMEDVRETSIFEGDGFLLPYGEMGFEGKKGGRYAGAYFDWDLGVYSFGVRRYSPDLGRFISVDPLFLERPGLCLGSPVECNLYSYAKNNPLKYVDPTGLKSARSLYMGMRPTPNSPETNQAIAKTLLTIDGTMQDISPIGELGSLTGVRPLMRKMGTVIATRAARS